MNQSAFQAAVDKAAFIRREDRKVPRRMRRILAAKDAAKRAARLEEVMA